MHGIGVYPVALALLLVAIGSIGVVAAPTTSAKITVNCSKLTQELPPTAMAGTLRFDCAKTSALSIGSGSPPTATPKFILPQYYKSLSIVKHNAACSQATTIVSGRAVALPANSNIDYCATYAGVPANTGATLSSFKISWTA